VKLVVEAMSLGALDFLEKPVNPDALLETLTRIRRERQLMQDRNADTYDALLARARVALVNMDLSTAEGLLLRAAPLGASDPVFHNLMGLLAELRADLPTARRHYGNAISLDRKFDPAQQNMRRLYELREFGHSNEPAAL
jgi:Flp pilus assembly protein TadD